MALEPGTVRSFIACERRRHAGHAAAFADEVDGQFAARAELLGGGTDVPVKLSCELCFAHVLCTTVLRRRIGAQRAARLGVAARRDSAGSVAPLP